MVWIAFANQGGSVEFSHHVKLVSLKSGELDDNGRYSLGANSRASFDSIPTQQHVSTIPRELHCQATMAPELREAIVQLVRQCSWI